MLSATMSPDDYILGAITIYLDVINLFLCLLRLLGDRRD
jgi:FtsH-binding integral membrane protein